MTVQTSYDYKPAVAMPGQVESKIDAVSRSLATAAGVDAGVFVAPGTSHRTCKAIAAAGDVTAALGLATYKEMSEPNTASARYAQYDTVSILRKGRGWVKVQGTIGDDVAAVYVVNNGANAGQIRADADTANATILAGVRVVQGDTAGGIALVEINLP